MYTISKKADKKVEEDMRIIKSIIIKKLKPISIILFGGFGHGEGSFEIIKGKVLPLNDYDLYVVTKKRVPDEILEEVGKHCSKAIGRGGKEFVEYLGTRYDKNKFFHVDIRCLEEGKLSKLLPTQRTADLKTSMIIYGEDIRKKIPSVIIPTSDALRLLFNKLDHFLLAENNTKEIKAIYAVKGLTDLCSALLITEKRYRATYKERAREFQKLDVSDELKKLVKQATKAKIDGFKIKNVDKFFKKSKFWVGFALKKVLEKELVIKSEEWKEIAKAMYKKLPFVYFKPYLKINFFPAQYYLNIKFFLEGLRKKEFLWKSLLSWRDPGLRIATALMLYSFGEEEEASRYLKTLINKMGPLKERILKLYSIYYLQKLI